jgi:CelD/BcsL family acetyltransferase involved in cellulose biosynthesis
MTWTIHPVADFMSFRQQWQALNAEGMASPLLDIDFVAPLLREFGTGNEVLACYEHAGQVQAMALLTCRRRGAWETFQPSQAPIGMWLQRPEVDSKPLLSSLLRKLPGFPLVVGITQQDPQLLRRPEDHGRISTVDYIETAKISLQGSFDEYWDARGKNLKQNMKKQRNKLEKEGVTLRLHVATAPEDVAAAVADFGKLESSGWKNSLGTAVHADNAQGRFYTSMLEAFCARGAGRIYRYFYNDQIAAMDLCIEGNGMIIILKTAYDESIKDGSSPAFLLRQEELKLLFEGGATQSVEFYGKVMEWHRKWTDEVRTVYHINHYRFALLPRLYASMKKLAPVSAQIE